MGLWQDLKMLWRSASLPHYTHLFTTKPDNVTAPRVLPIPPKLRWKTVSFNEPYPPLPKDVPPTPAPPLPSVTTQKNTCGFVPPTPGYAPCTREPHSDGPCAHPFTHSGTLSTTTVPNLPKDYVYGNTFVQEPTWVVPEWAARDTDDVEELDVDAIAQQLHKEYRAASKALKGSAVHDHGWKNCHNKKYFLNRARRWHKARVTVCL